MYEPLHHWALLRHFVMCLEEKNLKPIIICPVFQPLKPASPIARSSTVLALSLERIGFTEHPRVMTFPPSIGRLSFALTSGFQTHFPTSHQQQVTLRKKDARWTLKKCVVGDKLTWWLFDCMLSDSVTRWKMMKVCIDIGLVRLPSGYDLFGVVLLKFPSMTWT